MSDLLLASALASVLIVAPTVAWAVLSLHRRTVVPLDKSRVLTATTPRERITRTAMLITEVTLCPGGSSPWAGERGAVSAIVDL